MIDKLFGKYGFILVPVLSALLSAMALNFGMKNWFIPIGVGIAIAVLQVVKKRDFLVFNSMFVFLLSLSTWAMGSFAVGDAWVAPVLLGGVGAIWCAFSPR